MYEYTKMSSISTRCFRCPECHGKKFTMTSRNGYVELECVDCGEVITKEMDYFNRVERLGGNWMGYLDRNCGSDEYEGDEY